MILIIINIQMMKLLKYFVFIYDYFIRKFHTLKSFDLNDNFLQF